MPKRPSPRIDAVLAKVPAGTAAARLSGPRPGRARDRPRGLDQHRDHRARRWHQCRRRPERTGMASPSPARADPGLEPGHDHHLGPRLLPAAVASDPAWAGMAAVAANRIYLSPGLPFGWIDRPPSLNRLIGLRWASARLYPDLASAICARDQARVLPLVLSVSSLTMRLSAGCSGADGTRRALNRLLVPGLLARSSSWRSAAAC